MKICSGQRTNAWTLLPLSELSAAVGSKAPRCTLRRFLLLKYIQTLLLPLGNELLLAAGALASLHTLLVLTSPCLSRKASTVLLGQLAWADGLLLLRWGLDLESGLGLGKVWLSLSGVEATPWLKSGLLEAHHLSSLLLLSCVSLEALLVSRWAEESRHLRTVQGARLASALIWTGVALQLAVQLVGHCAQTSKAEGGSESDMAGGSVRVLMQVCATMAPLTHLLMRGLQALLWLANTWVLYQVFYRKSQKGKSCFH